MTTRRRLLLPLLALPLAACALARAGGAPSPRAVLARAVERAGGVDALRRARALMWEGDATVTSGGRVVQIAGRWAVQPPDTAVVETWLASVGPSSARSLVLAAPRGFIARDTAVAPMPAAMLANERDAFYLYDAVRLVSLLAPDVTLGAIAPDSLGRPGVRARRVGRPDLDLWMDATGRLAHVRAVVHDAERAGGTVTEDVWLSGEIVADGVRWPRHLVFTQNGAPYFDLTLRTLAVVPRVESPLLAGHR